MRSSSRALLLAAMLAGAMPAAHAVQDCELNGQSVNPANGNTTAGKTGLMRCRERDTGELRREQALSNGSFMGLVRIYDKGRLAREHTVNAKGNMDGRAREFAPDGTVLRDATYDDGRTVGLVRSFHPDGKLRRAAFHAEPGGERAVAEFTARGQLSQLRCGERALLAPAADDARLCGFGGALSTVELFDERGTPRARASYLDGRRLRQETLYDNGRPSVVEETDGQRRTERRFSSEGVRRRETVWRVSGGGAGERAGAVRQRESEYSETGTLVRERRWSGTGDPLADDSYYLNGQPRSKSLYQGGPGGGEPRTLELTEFHDNGQRAAQGRYTIDARGLRSPTGTHQRFSDSGVLLAESSFDARGRLSRERTWDESGRPQRDDEVFEDGSRKAYAR